MIMNIVEEGEEVIWLGIEMIINPIERAKQIGLYFEAIKKLKEKQRGGNND